MSYCEECFAVGGFHREFCSYYPLSKKPIDIPKVPEDAALSPICQCHWDYAGHPGACMKVSGEFVIKDSGERQQFESGMVRDTDDGKIDYTRVADGPMLKRWATHVTKAVTKYPDIAPGVPNWTQANGKAELIRAKKSAFRHFMEWYYEDETGEDKAAGVFFNINVVEYVKEKLK